MGSDVASRDSRRYSPKPMPSASRIIVDVGDVPVALTTSDAALLAMLERRFHRFLGSPATPAFEFDITVVPGESFGDADLEVSTEHGRWQLRRGDFRAEWDPSSRRGSIRQTRSPYAADCVLRIVHTLLLSREQGFLLHASSAIRNGRAFLFTGPSGAGKTTIVQHAPSDVTVLTDEISYVRRRDGRYIAFGTPFAGEWADVGEPVSAPVAAVFQLARGSDPEHTPLDEPSAVRTLMRNILFFAHDRTLTSRVLDTACDCAATVPAFRLSFAPGPRVWETIA